jgi:hypothetical protein
MSAIVENVVLGEGVVEKVVKEKAVKLQVKYERIYISLFTVLNSLCLLPDNEGDFVLKPEIMREILGAVEFYNDDVGVQSAFIEENIFSKENIKSCRKLMKAEKLQWKIDNGLIEKKKRGTRAKKAVVEKPVSVVVEKAVSVVVEKAVSNSGIPNSGIPDSGIPNSKGKSKAPRVKKEKANVSVEPVVSEPVVSVEPVEPVNEAPTKKVVTRKPKKKTELVEDKPLN